MKRSTRLILRAVSFVFTLAVCVTAFIYSGKNDGQSNSESKSVTDAVAQVAITDYQNLSEEKKAASETTLNTRIRKFAHTAEYMAMGAGAAVFALTFLFEKESLPACEEPSSDVKSGRKKTKKAGRRRTRPGALTLCALGWAFCLLYAIFDEAHQYFVPGRAGTAQDVALDAIAAGISVLILWGIVEARAANAAQNRTETE